MLLNEETRVEVEQVVDSTKETHNGDTAKELLNLEYKSIN